MTKFLFYLHKRLFVQEYGRAEIMDILARKTLKSIARSTGSRISGNRWIKTLEFLYRSTGATSNNYPEELALFVTKFQQKLDKYQRTHATSIGRVNLLLDYLDSRVNQNTPGFLSQLSNAKVKFEERNDLLWFKEAISRFGFHISGCGHVSDEGHHMHGNADTHEANRMVCHHCASEAVQSGEYARSGQTHDYYLAIYAVEVRAPWGTFMGDRRNPDFRFNAARNLWHTQDWTPYSNIIDNYHANKNNGFTLIESAWFKRHRRAFGIELEVQNRGGNSQMAAGRVHEVLNPSGEKGEYCFFERDGSIGEGFELITQPAGLDVHREKLALFLNNEDLKRGLRSHEGGSCGLHVHVGREFVTQAQIYRIQSFLNDVRNEGLIKKISRRYGNSYARMRPEMAKLSPIGKNSGERYEALNVTNRNTIEFRIFRGSLKYESVMAALEFVDALLTFCMPGQTSIMDFNAIGFRKFITKIENSPDTKFLRQYLHLTSHNATNDGEHRLAA